MTLNRPGRISPLLMPEPVSSAALDALGDANRRAIVEMLSGGPASVQSIADRLPISRPAVSRHLRLLKAAELVVDEPVGTQRVYRLRADGMDAIREYFEQLWAEASARYRIAVDNLDEKPRP